MGLPVKGEVVVLPFPFTNLANAKLRPALVVAVPRQDELLVCQITSQKARPEYQVVLRRFDFSRGKLDVDPSYIMPERLFLADPKIVKATCGKLTPKKLEEVINAITKILKEK